MGRNLHRGFESRPLRRALAQTRRCGRGLGTCTRTCVSSIATCCSASATPAPVYERTMSQALARAHDCSRVRRGQSALNGSCPPRRAGGRRPRMDGCRRRLCSSCERCGGTGVSVRRRVTAAAASGSGATQSTAISPARAKGGTSSRPSPLQKRPGSYQLAGRRLGSRPMCW
jgi:hypothetical protein